MLLLPLGVWFYPLCHTPGSGSPMSSPKLGLLPPPSNIVSVTPSQSSHTIPSSSLQLGHFPPPSNVASSSLSSCMPLPWMSNNLHTPRMHTLHVPLALLGGWRMFCRKSFKRWPISINTSFLYLKHHPASTIHQNHHANILCPAPDDATST